MLSSYPKQYITIDQKTILEHSVSNILKISKISYIIIVLKKNDIYFHKLHIAKNKRIITTTGGKTRSESVLQGLKLIKKAKWVLIHDAVRPCLHINDLYTLISENNINNYVGAILAEPIYDTVKRSKLNGIISHTIQRKNLWRALTPQIFKFKLLYACLKRALKDNINITDESLALEYCGYNPKVIKSCYHNIKITKCEDIKLAEYFLKK